MSKPVFEAGDVATVRDTEITRDLGIANKNVTILNKLEKGWYEARRYRGRKTFRLRAGAHI